MTTNQKYTAIRRLMAGLVVTMALGPLVQGQDVSPWIGQKVITKPETRLRVGDRVVEEHHAFVVFQVQKVNGDWLWLVQDSVVVWARTSAIGWVQSGEVVPFDQAINYFTQGIRANPGSSAAWTSRGSVWQLKDEYDIAIADYNEAIRLNPTNSAAFNNRGG